MKEFMGIKNVIDAVAIIGADGMADGFRIIYQEPRTIKTRNGKVIEKMVEKECVKYIREFDFNSVGSDGKIHGFGRDTLYTRSTPSTKKVVKKVASSKTKKTKMTKRGLAAVSAILKKKN